MSSAALYALLGYVKPAVVAIAAVWFWRAPPRIGARQTMTWLVLAWVVVTTYEFWILGGRSFASLGAEAEYSIPGLLYLNTIPSGTRFLPGLAGGVDAQAFATFDGRYFALERLWLMLPLGAANFVHKILLVGIATAGMYRLARSYPGVGRASAAAAAALFSLSHERLLLMTWGHGLGFALVPLACYLIVRRSGKESFYLPVVALALLNAASSTPTHSFLAMLAAVLAVVVIGDEARRPRLGRVLGAIAVMAAALLANGHEGLYAKSLVGPLTARGTDDPSLGPILNPIFLAVGAAGVGLLWFDRRRQLCLRFVLAGAFVLFGGGAVQALAAAVPALGPIKGINFQNVSVAFFTLAPLALVCARPGERIGAIPRGAAALFAALPLGQLAWLKLYIPLVWLSQGGLSVLSGGLAQLSDRPWSPAEPVRVISVPYRLPSNLAAAAGLDTFDGFFPLVPRPIEAFWNGILAPRRIDASSGSVGLDDAGMDFKCCDRYELGRHANLDLLRIANVGFVLSILPLVDARLTQVHGPADGVPPRSGDSPLARLKGYISLIFAPAPIRVYALPAPLPRLYAARAIRVFPAGAGEDMLLAQMTRTALAREVAVRAENWPAGAAFEEPVTIDAWTLRPDGASADVMAGRRGLLVFNVPHTPFWRAYVDGREETVFPVNVAQMATMVPAGARRVEFRYARPLLREKIARALQR